MIPKFLDMFPESRINGDELAIECMGRLVQSQVEFRQDAKSRPSGSYLHGYSQMLQIKLYPWPPPWNLSLLEALKLEEDLRLKGIYGSRHPHYQGVWKWLQCIFSTSKLRGYPFKVSWWWRERWPAFRQQLWTQPSRSLHLTEVPALKRDAVGFKVSNLFLYTQHWTPTFLGLCIYKRWTLPYHLIS